MTTKLPVEERVANGARWLDENFPGWEARIDIRTLDLGDAYACICGKVFERENHWAGDVGGGYHWAESNLLAEANGWITAFIPKDADRRNARARKVAAFLGFNVYGGEGEPSFKKLQNAWIDLLAERAKA